MSEKKIKKLTCWVAINRYGVVCGHRRRDFLVCDAFKQLFGLSWYDKIMSRENWHGKTEGEKIDELKSRIEATGWKIVQVEAKPINESAQIEYDMDLTA